jgi:hypothetical protein
VVETGGYQLAGRATGVGRDDDHVVDAGGADLVRDGLGSGDVAGARDRQPVEIVAVAEIPHVQAGRRAEADPHSAQGDRVVLDREAERRPALGRIGECQLDELRPRHVRAPA